MVLAFVVPEPNVRLFISATAMMTPSQRPLETTAMTCHDAAMGVSSPSLFSKCPVKDQNPHAMQNDTHALHRLVKKAWYGRMATTTNASPMSKNAAIEVDDALLPRWGMLRNPERGEGIFSGAEQGGGKPLPNAPGPPGRSPPPRPGCCHRAIGGPPPAGNEH